ncbi:unnamed protein product [Malus baccata var. baccata]
MTMSNNVTHGQFGDTTLTKVFVGELAWETPKEILEAVIISDKLTGARSMSLAPAPAPANHVQWYYPAPTGTPATPFHLQHHQAAPFYGRWQANGGTQHYDANVSYLLPHHHQSHTMGLPAHIYSPTMAGHVAAVQTIMSKPASIAPNTDMKLCTLVEGE